MDNKIIKKISKDLNINESEFLESSISTFLDRSLRNAMIEVEKIKSKYSVQKPEELEKLIEEKKIDAHPAWEDLIEWKNLAKKVEVVKKWVKNLNINA